MPASKAVLMKLRFCGEVTPFLIPLSTAEKKDSMPG